MDVLKDSLHKLMEGDAYLKENIMNEIVVSELPFLIDANSLFDSCASKALKLKPAAPTVAIWLL